MRVEILVLAALAAFVSAAPQWPYRDAVAPYYYGYPGKTPYMYRSGDEDDEMDESYLARQDLKVAANPANAGSTVTVVEDDEKADGVRVVETGSAKQVAQSGNNQQNDQNKPVAGSSSPAASQQAQQPQPLSNNNASPNNNNAQPQSVGSGQPLTATAQQPGQQPPQAFPPARPPSRPRPNEEDEDEEEDDSEEEDEEDAEDDEDGDSDEDDENDDEEEDDEDRKRNDVASQKPQEASASSEEPSPVVVPVAQEPQPVQPQASIVASSEGSDEEQEEAQPVEQAQQQSQSAVLNNKVSKNKQSNNAVVVPVNNVGKKKVVAAAAAAGSKVKSPGAIEALVPGYVTDQGEVLVPVDTVTGSQPITIVPDPFSPPSRIVSGPRPIPQSSVPATPSRQVPYWYRNSPNANPLISEPQAIGRQTLYSSVPPPGSIFTFDDDDDDDDADTPAVIPGNRLRQDEEEDDDDDEDDEQDDESEENDENAKPVKKVPLAAVPAVGSSGEDDEAEALAFVNNGKPVSNRRPSTNAASSANKKPTGTSNAGAKQPSSNESESEEEESEEADVDSQEDDDDARSVAVPQNNRGRMYVDEDYVSFPPSRSPSVFAIVQGSFPQHQRRQQQPQYFSSAVPGNPYQRYVVRVTPSGNRPRPTQSLYYRPVESRPPNRRVVPVASFDVSVEDTRPSPSSFESDEEGVSVVPSGGPTPVTSFPFVYKVQGSLQGIPRPSGGPGLRPSRPPRPYYSSGPSGRPYGGSSPYASFVSSIYGPYGPPRTPYGAPRPPLGLSNGPPVIVRRKQPGGGPNRPPKPHLIAVYNPTGSSPSESGRPRPREPVDEEYYTFEVPSTNNKIVSSAPPKRPTVHRKPTPVIHQKLVAEDEEENSDESVAPAGPSPPGLPFKIIPQGTVRRRTVRGGKQLKPKKNSKKTASTKKQQQQDQQQDPLGILHKVNKSSNKSKLH